MRVYYPKRAYLPVLTKKINKMKKFKLRNERGLISFLSSYRCNYEVIQDGWAVLITCNSFQEFFNIAKSFYLLSNTPQMITIEEIEQRGDLPTA